MIPIEDVGACFGFYEDEFVGYFSSGIKAREAECSYVKPIDKEYIHEDGTVFFVILTVTMITDDRLNFIMVTHSREENIKKFQELLSKESLQTICDDYLAMLEKDDELGCLNGHTDPAELILELNVLNGIDYPDEE